MDLLSFIPDNISELLVKIVRFTELRRSVLHKNIHSVDQAHFVPHDLPVREFADVLHGAVAEHVQTRRLLFRDTGSIRFGPRGQMRVSAEPDEHARALLASDRDAYMELQINRLLENALNRKVARELLRQTCGVCPALASSDGHGGSAGEDPLENTSAHYDAAD